MYRYKTTGICAKEIEFDIINDLVCNVKFYGGCSGNLQGISNLIEGQPIDLVISKLKGIDCNNKRTSCPDQLAKALESIKEKV